MSRTASPAWRAGLCAGALALAGCLDLDELRARAADAGVDAELDRGCQGDVRDLRLWRLHLGQSDYVALKNPSECAIELSGVHVFFDDIDEAFPDTVADCLVRIPALRVAAGAEVRVHEHPSAGDVGVLEGLVSGCGAELSFNPTRGGVTYLCDGLCAADTVIDVVAHHGEGPAATPPRMLFGQRFDAPLSGVTVATQESTDFRRVAIRGAPPSFTAEDWTLQRRSVHASFEAAVEVEVDGEVGELMFEPGQPATFSSSGVAAIGSVALSLRHRGSDGRSEAMIVPLETAQGGRKPSYVSFYTRIDGTAQSAGFVDLQGGGFTAIRVGFARSGLGVDLEHGQRIDVVVSADEFHQVELRNLDFGDHRFDLYVDRVLVAARVPFLSNALMIESLALYSTAAGSTVHWDELELWE